MRVHTSLRLAPGFQHKKRISLLVWMWLSEKGHERTAKGELWGQRNHSASGVCIWLNPCRFLAGGLIHDLKKVI